MNCELHKFHRPKFLTDEDHHIVPQAWQHFWGPTQMPPITGLWIPDVASLCPTGHRNVHWVLVLMMKNGYGEDPLQYRPRRRLTNEEKMAFLGITKFKEAGGSLEALRKAKLYGYA